MHLKWLQWQIFCYIYIFLFHCPHPKKNQLLPNEMMVYGLCCSQSLRWVLYKSELEEDLSCISF